MTQQLHFFGVYPRRMKAVHSVALLIIAKIAKKEKKVNNLNVFQSVWLNKLPYPYIEMLLSKKKEEEIDMCITWIDVMGVVYGALWLI